MPPRIAARTKGADLLAVHVTRSDGLSGGDPAYLARQRVLVEDLGGTYHQVVGTDIPDALLAFARGVNATQLVLGASRRGRWAQLFSRGVGVTTTAESGSIDVHLITHEETARRGRIAKGRDRPWRSSRGGLSLGRRTAGFILGVAALPALTALLLAVDADVSLSTDVLAFLLVVVAVALAGGLLPALVAAIGGSLLLNYFFTPPVRTFTIAEREICSPCSRSSLWPCQSVWSSTSRPAEPGKRHGHEPRLPHCPHSRAACFAASARCRRSSSRSARRSLWTQSLSSSAARRPSVGLMWSTPARPGLWSRVSAAQSASHPARATPRYMLMTPTRWSCPDTRWPPRIAASWRLLRLRPPLHSDRSVSGGGRRCRRLAGRGRPATDRATECGEP